MSLKKSGNKYLKSPFGRGAGVGYKKYHLFPDFSSPALNSLVLISYLFGKVS